MITMANSSIMAKFKSRASHQLPEVFNELVAGPHVVVRQFVRSLDSRSEVLLNRVVRQVNRTEIKENKYSQGIRCSKGVYVAETIIKYAMLNLVCGNLLLISVGGQKQVFGQMPQSLVLLMSVTGENLYQELKNV